MNVIRVDHAAKSFKGVQAVRDLSFVLGEGEILGFLGTNGAGKTTTVKMLLGLLSPDAGTVRLFDGDPTCPATREKVGFMPETANYYPYLKPLELLEFYGGLCGLSRRTVRQRGRELLDRVGLADAMNRPLKTFSKGMLQRAGLAQALLAEPRLLVLDEPFTGLDPLARIRLRELVQEFRSRGGSVFFSSHELGETEMLCDRVIVMKDGRSVYDGPTRGLGEATDNTSLESLFLKVLGGAR